MSSVAGPARLKRTWPAAERNKAPILEVLRGLLPSSGLVLEVATGTGQHAAHFAEAIPALHWQPSDLDPDTAPSVAEWCGALPNVRPCLTFDVTADWPIEAADAIYCANMVHIAPWPCAQALMAGAGRILPSGAPLLLYGPFKFDGVYTAPSNERFDASLRGRNASWGVRDVEDLRREASAAGLSLEQTLEMPANNHVLLFRRA